ncbi:MAG TPA: serine hydrolase domain-containing protein [Marmoricola sp.]
MATTDVHGDAAPGFEPLRDLLARGFDDGTEAGASLALIRDGEVVVDLWGGEAKPGVPWAEDTIVQVWSVTKTMAALTALILADRGQIDLDAPVASYWPDFAAAGKEGVLVRHLLAHTSGLAGWTDPITFEQMLDLEYAEAALAAQAPWWTPGDGSGYHMIDYGHLVDGLVRAATGSPLADQFRRLVAEPLGVDFKMGVPDADLVRCADMIPPPPGGIDVEALPEGNMLLPTLVNPLLDIGGACNTTPWRSISVAGANGHGNARSVARAQSVISHGGEVDGIRLLSQSMIDRIFEVQAEGPDRVLLLPAKWGIGYSLPVPVSAPAVPDRDRVCWWTGYGGAIVVNDLTNRVTFAYAMNKLDNHFMSSPRTDAYVRTTFDCLGLA